jgi:hypothetical protein
MLEVAAAKSRLKKSDPREEDYQVLEQCLSKLHKLWRGLAQLRCTPKMHSLLNHRLECARNFDGISDSLEDDIKHMHQMSVGVEAWILKMKNKSQQTFGHSKIEVSGNYNGKESKGRKRSRKS